MWIHDPSAWRGRHFQALVEHLEQFDAGRLERLSALYGAPEASAQAIAVRWCTHPEVVHDVIDSKLRTTSARALLEDLVLDHDLSIRTDWADRRAAKQLAELGLLTPDWELMASVPGALAAILAPRVSGMRATLPILLGRASEEEVMRLAARHGVQGQARIPTILALSELFTLPETLEQMLGALPEAEWLGGALMVLELGGTCYWQEVFGDTLDEDGTPSRDPKVVPLMRVHERALERDIAQCLMEIGLVFRVDEPEQEQPMVVVPEELWSSLWELGRSWLLDWDANAFEILMDSGARYSGRAAHDDLLTRLKWFACEIVQRPVLASPSGELPAQLGALTSRSEVPLDDLDVTLELARELEIIDVRQDRWLLDAQGMEHLELSRPAFTRHVLHAWCWSEAGRRADAQLGQAVGLDEAWRAQCLEVMRHQIHISLPHWLHVEGLEPELTGTGYLRALEAATPDIVRVEYELTRSGIGGLKLLWLDLLSALPSDQWYPLAALSELLQLSCAVVFFNHLVHLLEQPNTPHYMPVQRASFLTDPAHTSSFEQWCLGIVCDLLQPLGVALWDEADERVWLDTRHLRLPNPPGIPEEIRVVLPCEVLGIEPEAFPIPAATTSGFQPKLALANTAEAGRLDLNLSLKQILDQLGDRPILRYDGRYLYTD